MAQTTSDVLVERLVDWGVDTVFGIPGDGINGIMEALRTRKDRIRFVQTRHEEAAAFMACGHARVTGKLGVCLATSGPGGIHLLNGLYLPIKVVVIKNNTLGQIKWEQMVFLGNPEYGCELQPMDYAGFAEVSGMRGFRIEDPKTCGRTLDEALAVPGPALVEAVVDPFEPPMPGKISLDQAAMFARSLVRGEPNRAQIALTAVSNKVRELV